jgi:hypothetical protein
MFLNAATMGLVISLANPQSGNNSPTRIKGIKNGLVITRLDFAEYLFIWLKFFFIFPDYHYYPQNLHPFCRYNMQFAGHYGFSGL